MTYRLIRGLSLDHPERTHLDAIREFARPFGYLEERDGAIVHDVRPSAGMEQTQSSLGRAAFDAHSDVAFLPPHARPEFLSLFCIENQGRTATLVWELERILASLPGRIVDLLSQPIFEQIPPLTFQAVLGSQPLTGHRILEDGAVAYSAQGTRAGSSPESRESLKAFEDALDRTAPKRVTLEPGSLLVLDNLRSLHGREAICGARWLQRIYSRRDLSTLAAGATSDPAVFRASALR
jgi:L-asparagine oxygenase